LLSRSVSYRSNIGQDLSSVIGVKWPCWFRYRQATCG
jgi:hypothetical protein